ncbi:MAG TPA: hypothetical protein VMK12_22685 [Anaeromyxobacteraceae bacterium]|nr:hypothetical protein [Anaeromyxobacteraceae bacterium]
MSQQLYPVEKVDALIRSGASLLLAGEEAPLRRLPKGNWIAGTIPYFMTSAGGCVDRERIFVTELPSNLTLAGIRRYGDSDIARIYSDLPSNAFGVLIAPASSPVHLSFALNAPNYEKFAVRPLIGWISGVHLSQINSATPKVFDGTSAEALDKQAVVMHVALPPGKVAELGIINIFKESDGPAITFPSSGFTATMVDVDGEKRNLAEFIKEKGLDTRAPLVADYCGTSINVSFQSVDHEKGEVKFYAPVFEGLKYRHAKPASDYVTQFVSRLPRGLGKRLAFSCNCILNYLHSSLEGRKTGGIVGPITFGEIAYQLLNQTMVYVTIDNAHR